MIKTIWLVNPYVEPPHLETRLRTIMFAKHLTNKGFEVVLIGGSFIHNTEINLIEDSSSYVFKNYGGLNFIHIKTPSYKGNGIMRFINLHTFYKTFRRKYREFGKPDLILHSATIPFGYNLYKVARKMKARYFSEMLDLWPEAFVDFGLIKRNSIIHQILKKFEFIQYKNSEKLIFSMEGGKDYIIDQHWDKKIDMCKVFYINNGVELTNFNESLLKYKINDPELESKKFKIIYLGSIRLVNNLMKLIKAAESIYKQGIVDIQFLIYGDGTEREELEKYVISNKIENISFKQKYVEIEYVPYILSKSNLNVLNYMDNDIWKYGGSQSKLFQYLASGVPILSNLKIGYCIISKYKCGIAKKLNNTEDYANAILQVYRMETSEYNKWCQNARKASQNFDYGKLTDDFIELFER